MCFGGFLKVPRQRRKMITKFTTDIEDKLRFGEGIFFNIKINHSIIAFLMKPIESKGMHITGVDKCAHLFF